MTPVFSPANDAFWTELSERAVSADCNVLLLERLARGGGARSWYLLQDPDDVVAARDLVRPGAGLTAYFAITFVVHGQAGTAHVGGARQALDGLGPNDELVALSSSAEAPRLEADYVSTAAELDEWLEGVPGQEIWICGYPDWLPDGDEAMTVVVPDADGVVRDHPY